MINIAKKTENGATVINIVGHAGYARIGEDIVCAAVSILVDNLVLSIEELTKDCIIFSAINGNATIEFEDITKETQLSMPYHKKTRRNPIKSMFSMAGHTV